MIKFFIFDKCHLWHSEIVVKVRFLSKFVPFYKLNMTGLGLMFCTRKILFHCFSKCRSERISQFIRHSYQKICHASSFCDGTNFKTSSINDFSWLLSLKLPRTDIKILEISHFILRNALKRIKSWFLPLNKGNYNCHPF